MILFLDFDGVLHPEPCYDETAHFCCLPRFEQMIADYPDVSIVISSTWRTREWKDVLAPFSTCLHRRIIGKTPLHTDFAAEDSIGRYVREAECREWLRTSSTPYSDWIALDDKAHWFTPFCKNLVLCNAATGFDADTELKLRQKLEGQ